MRNCSVHSLAALVRLVLNAGSAMSKSLGRRTALQTLLVGTSALAFARFLDACSDASTSDRGGPGGANEQPPAAPPPNDGDEFVPGKGDPVDTGDTPPVVPNAQWEARAKQLEDQQQQTYGTGAFTQTAPGPFAGKERSHVPTATTGMVGKYKQITVLVSHVMGANGLDGGAYDGGDAGDGGKDGGDAGKDGGDAGDAGKLDAGDAGDAGKLDAGDGGKLDASVDAGEVHYITTIYIRGVYNGKDTVVGLWEFVSTDPAPPSVKFTIPDGVGQVTAWEHCTLHGLWKTDPITL
jgi:hypothetical protein